ncbi:MAG TPA: MFS transporter [Petrotogaceae bacterium]|nr:MFS transporter [Petrotogaceae bacterium]HQP58448.1 MFS transporter [Petrotogaceae bacterium]
MNFLKKMNMSPTMKYAIAEGATYNAAYIGTQGFIFTTLSIYFNATPLQLSIMTTMPLAASMIQIIIPYLYRIFRNRKELLVITAFFARIATVLIPISILFDFTNSYILFVVMMIFSIFSSFTGNVWTSAMKQIVPDSVRGSYFGLRNYITSIITVVFTMVYSYLMKTDSTKLGLLIVSTLMFIFFISSVFLLSKHSIPDTLIKKEKIDNPFTPFQDKDFRKYLLFTSFWNFSIEFCKPFFSYYQVAILKADYTFLGLASTISALLSMFLYILYGKFSDKFGNKNTIRIGIIFSLTGPLIFLFMTPDNYIMMTLLDAFITSFAWAAINLGYFNLLLESAKEPSEMYFSLNAFICGISAIAASFIGGNLGNLLQKKSFVIFDHLFFGIQFIFFLEILLRIISILILNRVKTAKGEKKFTLFDILPEINSMLKRN